MSQLFLILPVLNSKEGRKFSEFHLGTLRFVDGNYIKLHQHGLQGCRGAEAIGLSRGWLMPGAGSAAAESVQLCGLYHGG